ncbi:MAG: DNA-binding protein [Nanoarchaeota archaeon]|nr:DNA-binding protein [Nanoarchaeota archaeon]
MKIAEIQSRQGKIDIEAEVVEKGEVREFQKFGRAGKVCNAKIKDDSGEIDLTLWNEDVDKVEVGDKVKLTNGYCNEFQGNKQVTAGKFGKLEIAGKEETVETESAEEGEEKE